MLFCRSPWKARECFQGRRYSKESDVWAFGIVLWEMFMKTVPFQNMEDDTVKLYIKSLCLAKLTARNSVMGFYSDKFLL